MDTVWLTPKAAALAPGDRQLPHDSAPAHASRLVQSSFLAKHQITRDSVPPQPRFSAPFLLAFPKTSPVRRQRCQTVGETQGHTTGQLWCWAVCVRPQGPTWKGAEASPSCVRCFLRPLQSPSLLPTSPGRAPSGQTACVFSPHMRRFGRGPESRLVGSANVLFWKELHMALLGVPAHGRPQEEQWEPGRPRCAAAHRCCASEKPGARPATSNKTATGFAAAA